jgi:hypothetical protein
MTLSRSLFLAKSVAFSVIAPTSILAQGSDVLRAAPSKLQLAPQQYP